MGVCPACICHHCNHKWFLLTPIKCQCKLTQKAIAVDKCKAKDNCANFQNLTENNPKSDVDFPVENVVQYKCERASEKRLAPKCGGTIMRKVTEKGKMVMDVMDAEYEAGNDFVTFATIAEKSGLTRKQVSGVTLTLVKNEYVFRATDAKDATVKGLCLVITEADAE